MTTQHLTVRDIMIGDWVKVTDDDSDKWFFGIVCGIDRYNVVVLKPGNSVGYPYAEECVEPIPLTPEILEKNGFASYNNSSFQLRENGIYISWRNVGRLNLSFGCAPTNDLHIKCKCVHQLQHALKLCRINKEIIL